MTMDLLMWLGVIVLGGLAIYGLLLLYFWWASRGDRH
jgi:hypothetical protein